MRLLNYPIITKIYKEFQMKKAEKNISRVRSNPPEVYIKRCEEYDREKILKIIREGMNALKYAPQGRVFVKPNVVLALGDRYGTAAYTAPELVGSALVALSQTPGVSRVDMGENTAVGFPTRHCFSKAGYYRELRQVKKRAKAPVRIFCIDEELRDRYFIGGAVHDVLRIPRKMARSDSKVYLPKLKCHCVSTMTGAVKLNIGICSDDERSIRHDFMLDDKIVDLLAAGYPDFIIMDAVEVGVGNEAVPTSRKLGLILMGKNPLAVDLVGARLLGYALEEVPYLKRAVERGYTPGSLKDVRLMGDITSLKGLDDHAKRLLPHDGAYTRWQDVNKEFARLHAPIRLYHGQTPGAKKGTCDTGCIMGIKMYMGFMEAMAGDRAFLNAKPHIIVIGRPEGTIDAEGKIVFTIGTCSRAHITNAKKIYHIDRCFTTASDMSQVMPQKTGMPSPYARPVLIAPLLGRVLIASLMKLVKFRYFQDIGHFMSKMFLKKF